MNRRVLVAAVVVPLLMIGVLVATAGSMTYWFGLARPANEAVARSLCEDAIRHHLVAPTNSSFRGAYVKKEHVFEDDSVVLGADAAHLTEKWVVGGTVESLDKFGHPAQSQFSCRAYLFDNQVPRTSVTYGDADVAGQRRLGP